MIFLFSSAVMFGLRLSSNYPAHPIPRELFLGFPRWHDVFPCLIRNGGEMEKVLWTRVENPIVLSMEWCKYFKINPVTVRVQVPSRFIASVADLVEFNALLLVKKGQKKYWQWLKIAHNALILVSSNKINTPTRSQLIKTGNNPWDLLHFNSISSHNYILDLSQERERLLPLVASFYKY